MTSKNKTKKEEANQVKSVKADETKKQTVATDMDIEKNVAADTDIEKNVAAVERCGTVISNRLNVRKGPSKTADIVKVISKGDKVEIKKSVNDEWYEITGGFVMKAFIDG